MQKQQQQQPQEQHDDEFELLEGEEQKGKGRERTMLDKLEELGIDQESEPNLAKMKERVDEIVRTLVQFQELKEEGRTRQSYLQELVKYLCAYYGYNEELLEMFVQMFHPNELVQFLDSNETQRPTTLRVNSLKSKRKELAQSLIQRGVNLDPLADWTKVGLKVYESKVPLGATPEYLAGHYMLQSASSFVPVMALAPLPGDKVMDMAAAPGGKTTYIAQLMKNQGILLANDLKKERLTSLKFNLQRMGVQNSIVCNYDGRKLPGMMKNFDKVLLDAPCTGLGIISRDASIKASRNYKEIRKQSHLQKELILAAIDCCKEGGLVVYSTCSVMVQENEEVVNYALKNRFVKVLDLGVNLGEEGIIKYNSLRYDDNIKKSRRIYPHLLNMDGFYVCKIKKLKNGVRKQTDEQKEHEIKKIKEKKDKKENKLKKNKKESKIQKKKEQKEEKMEQKEKDMTPAQKALYEKVKNVQKQEAEQYKKQQKEIKEQGNNQSEKPKKMKKKKQNKDKNETKVEKVQENKVEKVEKVENKEEKVQKKEKKMKKKPQENDKQDKKVKKVKQSKA